MYEFHCIREQHFKTSDIYFIEGYHKQSFQTIPKSFTVMFFVCLFVCFCVGFFLNNHMVSLGHLCEMEGNWLLTATIKDLGTSWLKVITKMIKKRQVSFEKNSSFICMHREGHSIYQIRKTGIKKKKKRITRHN